MRIGKRLRGSVFWSLAMTLGMTAGASAGERQDRALGGTLDGQSGDRYFGVYIPTRFGGELTITASSGQVVELKGPRGTVSQRPGRRTGSGGLGHLQGEGGQAVLHGGNHLRPGRPEREEALELLLLADEGRLDP